MLACPTLPSVHGSVSEMLWEGREEGPLSCNQLSPLPRCTGRTRWHSTWSLYSRELVCVGVERAQRAVGVYEQHSDIRRNTWGACRVLFALCDNCSSLPHHLAGEGWPADCVLVTRPLTLANSCWSSFLAGLCVGWTKTHPGSTRRATPWATCRWSPEGQAPAAGC